MSTGHSDNAIAEGPKRCQRKIGRGVLTRSENRGKTKPSLSPFLTSSSPWRTRAPGCGAPSSEGQKNAVPTLSRKTLLLRPAAGSSCTACEPTRRRRMRCRRTADGVASRSRACSSLPRSVRTIGIGLPRAYVSCVRAGAAKVVRLSATSFYFIFAGFV